MDSDKAIRSAKLTAKGVKKRRDTASENIADYVAELLRQGRASEVTDDLMAQADPQRLHHHYTSGNTGMDLPMDKKSRMERADQIGFDVKTPLYHGTQADFSSHIPSSGSYGRSVYTTTDPEKASRYADNHGDSPAGANVQPLLSSAAYRSPPPTNFQIDDPASIRSQFARFDPRLTHLSHLSASTGGAMELARAVMAKDRAGGQIAPSKYLPEVPRQVHADGGRVYPLDDRSGWYGDANYEQTGGNLVMMSPDEYLSKVRPLNIDEASRDNIDDLKQHILSGRKLDPLKIDARGREDGRHRAHAARELGIKQVPVLTWPREGRAYGGYVPKANLPVPKLAVAKPLQPGSAPPSALQSLAGLTQAATGVADTINEVRGVTDLKDVQNTADPNSGTAYTGTTGGHTPNDGHDHSGMSEAAMSAYGKLVDAYGQPLTIVSGYRDPEHNKRVGGAGNSQHTHGNAYDFDTSHLSHEERLALADKAWEAGFRGIGFYDNNMHFDVGDPRAWGPSYSRDSIPDWALPWAQERYGYADGGSVTDLGQVREQKQVQTFHEGLMDDVRDRMTQLMEAHQKAVDAGHFDGYEIGDVLQSKSVSGNDLPPMKITGRYVQKWKPNAMMLRHFDRMGAKPTIIEHEGQQYIPMLRYTSGSEAGGDSEEGTLYLDGVKAQFASNRMRKMGGLRAVKAEGGSVVDLNMVRATRDDLWEGAEQPDKVGDMFSRLGGISEGKEQAYSAAKAAGVFDNAQIGDKFIRKGNQYAKPFTITDHIMRPATGWKNIPESAIVNGHFPQVEADTSLGRQVIHLHDLMNPDLYTKVGGKPRAVKADGGSVAERSPMFEGMSEHLLDDEGKPMELWHGTPGQPFEAFDDSKLGSERDHGFYGRGHYLTPIKGNAEGYADPDEMGTGTVMGPMHAALKNPYIWDTSDGGAHRTLRDLQSMGIMTGQAKLEPWDNLQRHHIDPFMREMRKRGHDGVLVKTDRGLSEVVVFNPNMIKHRDAEVGDPEDPRIMRSTGGRLYSKAASIIRGLKDQPMQVDDIVKYALGKGVKQAEIDHTDPPRGGKARPSQVAQHIEDMQPQIGVQRLGESQGLTPQENAEFATMTAPGAPFPTGAAMERYRELSAKLNPDVPPRFARYQLPEGQNYREHVLTLDSHGGPTYTFPPHWSDTPNPLVHVRMSDRMVMPSHDVMRGIADRVFSHQKGIDGAAEEGKITPEEAATFARYFGATYSQHYDKPGLEKKILHVEELQSDWNNDARRKGFRTGTEEQDYQKYVDKMRDDAVSSIDPTASPMIRQALRAKYNTMDPYMLAMKMGRQEEHRNMYESAFRNAGVPKAPYINPERDDAAEVGMKHVLTEAAKGGYDGITFTPDKAQTARWGSNFNGMYDKKFPGMAQRLLVQHHGSTDQPEQTQLPGTDAPSALIPMSGDVRDSILKNGFPTFRRGGYVTQVRRAR